MGAVARASRQVRLGGEWRPDWVMGVREDEARDRGGTIALTRRRRSGR
jgi:hypothetical protein